MQDQCDASSDSPEAGGRASERPELSLVPDPPPTVDTPTSESREALAVATASPETPPGKARRALKLVMSFQPRDGQSYRVLLALGTEGCDPLIRSLEVSDTEAAITMIPALIDEAETQWRVQPRFPTIRPVKAPRPTISPKRPTDPSPAASSTTESTKTGGAESPESTKTTGQLSLFS